MWGQVREKVLQELAPNCVPLEVLGVRKKLGGHRHRGEELGERINDLMLTGQASTSMRHLVERCVG